MATAGDGDYTGYYVMKDCHDKAYALITEALDMDESGIGRLRVGSRVCSFLMLNGCLFCRR